MTYRFYDGAGIVHLGLRVEWGLIFLVCTRGVPPDQTWDTDERTVVTCLRCLAMATTATT